MPDISPSIQLLRKLFGDGVSPDDPELQKSWAGRQIEMPSEANKVTRISNMGPLTKFFNPDAYAITGPLGTVALNRNLINKDNQNLDDVLVHELTHVGQGKLGFLRKYFTPSKLEDEAINKEATRNVRRNDIQLFK